MDRLVKLAALFLAELAREAGRGSLLSRLVVTGVCAALGGLSALAAIAWLVAALWLFAVSRWDTVTAALLCAGALVLVGGVLALVGVLALRRRASGGSDGLRAFLRGADAGKLVREHKGESLIGALVLGFILGSAAFRSKPEKKRPDD